MARHCKQHLATAHELEAGSTGIDVVWIESLLEFPNVNLAASGELASMSCALVSLVQTPQALARLAHLAASLTGVRTRRQRFGGSSPTEEFAVAMRSRDDDFASFVVLLDDSPTVSRNVQELLEALRAGNPDTTGLVVAVSGHADRRRDLKGIDGFVLAEERRSMAVAASLCVALASMAAPFLWSCVDPEDVRPALGCPDRPSTLIEAIWAHGSDELLFASEADHQTVRLGSSAAVFVYVDEQDIGFARQAVRAVRRHMPDVHHLVYQVAVDFLIQPVASPNAVPVTLICGQAPE